MARQKEITYNEYWKTLVEEARRRGLRKGEWMKAAGVSYRRYSEFSTGKDLTLYYFAKLLGGLSMSAEQAENKAGRKMSKEQRNGLQAYSQFQIHKDTIIPNLIDPEMLQVLKALNEDPKIKAAVKKLVLR